MLFISAPARQHACMHCRKCRVKMVEQGRVFHGKRKWICPKCGRARMQSGDKPDRKKEPRVLGE